MKHPIVRAVVIGVVAVSSLAVGTVVAKVPYFSVEVSPQRPVDGDHVVVVVRLWDDAQHTRPAVWWPEGTIEGLLEFRGDGGRVPVELVRVDAATYSAEVTLGAGAWRLVPFPRAGGGVTHGAGLDGYPAPTTVTVASRMSGAIGAAIVMGGVLGIVTVALRISEPVRRELRRLRPGAVTR